MLKFEKIDSFITCSIFDSARDSQILNKIKELQGIYISLYQGATQQTLGDVAPYLVKCRTKSRLNKWILENGWGNSWGIFIQSQASTEEIRKHFRKFLLVETEEEEELYFRFYDPRVLRVFLPTCNYIQLNEFFGPVQKYICEDEDPVNALVFSLENGALQKELINLFEEPERLIEKPKNIPKPATFEVSDENTIV